MKFIENEQNGTFYKRNSVEPKKELWKIKIMIAGKNNVQKIKLGRPPKKNPKIEVI